MAEGSDARAWEELIPDALSLIFRNLPLQEILTVIPRVCKSWSRVVLGPYYWQKIDIDELSVSGLHTESMFTLIANHAGSLQRLELPRSEMNDAIVKLVLVRSKRLDLSLSDPDHYALIASDSFVKVKWPFVFNVFTNLKYSRVEIDEVRFEWAECMLDYI
ncbi:hypothetical protein ZIOFF_035499 [Zingiber officinale]|uniref:F-box domain-containing protein n=1 Tax=Zingiber officinale TaxID=94328 RepID=A0A8J5GKJ6_ZINOF|nr:hypothetical protein ZIOFF_035499 [Zingiber officinale]